MAGYFARATLIGLATLPPVWGLGWLVWLLMDTSLDTGSYWVSMTGVGIGWLIGWWLLKPLADFYDRH